MLPDGSSDLPIYVLDSCALLAFLGGEDGGKEVKLVLRRASRRKCRLLMSVVSLGEVAYITERERGLARVHEVLARIRELPVNVIDVNRSTALEAAHLKANYPLAYADCFVAALARAGGATVVTGVPEFGQLETDSEVAVSWLLRHV